MTALLNQLEMSLNSLENGKRLLEEKKGELMRRCGEQNMVVARNVRKLVKNVPTCSVGIAIAFDKAILKRCLKEISVLDLFSENLRQKCTGHSERNSESRIVIGGGECVVLLDPASPLRVDIYRRSYASQSTVLGELVEARFESAENAAGFEKEATNAGVFGEFCNSGVLKVRLRKSLSDTHSARDTTARYVLFLLLGYQRLVSKFSVSSDMDLREKNEEIPQAQ